MPVGVRAYASFVPRYRLPLGTIREAWAAEPAGKPADPARARAVAGFDEDALTLACEAALPIAEGKPLGGVWFASASAPYAEKSMASMLAGVCDIPFERTRSTDLAGSARAGVSALLAASERLLADPQAGDALVAAADVRTPPPESDQEGLPGDAAAAFLVGRSELAAELIGWHSVAAEMLDVWRETGDPFVRSADSKFAQSAGFAPATRAAIAGALALAKVEPRDVAAYALGAPSRAAAESLLKSTGVDPSKLASSFEQEIGNCGVAQAPLSFAAALERSKPGQVIVVAAWGDGADALVFRTTERVASWKPPRSVQKLVESGRSIGGYGRYLKARRLAGSDWTTGPEATNVLFAKEQEQNLRLHGAKCRHCGVVQFPPQQTCVSCRKEGTDRIRLSRRGKVFTFTRDSLNVAPEPITVMAVVDLEGGGRLYLPLTDLDPAQVTIGMEVELTFRYYHSGGEFRQYFWKARPIR